MSITCLAGVAVFAGLGTWQIQRLFWKNDLIEKIEARARAEPVSLDSILAEGHAGQDIRFERVSLSGAYRHGSELHFYTIRDGEPGWRVVTPFKLGDQREVLIDRGFVPMPFKDQESRQDGLVTDPTRITGAVRADYAPKGAFTRQNMPRRNRWYWLDRGAALEAAKVTRAIPFVLQLEASDHAGTWPQAVKISPRLPNNHLSYALTWFGMAIGLVLVFAVTIVKSRAIRSEA